MRGEEATTDSEIELELQATQEEPSAIEGMGNRLHNGVAQLRGVGQPVALGLAILARLSSIAVDFLVRGIWIRRTRWQRSKRL